MIGDGGDGRAEGGVDLLVLRVALGQIRGIVEDVLRERVDRVLGDIVAGEDDGGDSDGDRVGVQTVDIRRDGDLGVVRGCGEQLIDVLVIEGDEVDVLRGGEVGDGGRGRAGDDERRVDLAVLQGVGAVAEGLIGGLDVSLGQAVGAEDVHRVEVHAGTGRADRDALALKVSDGLDAGVGRDDLHLLGVEGGDSGEAVDLAVLLKQVRAVVGVGHDVGLAESQVSVAVGQLEDVGLRTVADKADDIHARVVGGMLGQHGAECVVRAGLAAGDEAELRAVRGRGRRRGIGAGSIGGSGVGLGGVFAAGDEAQQHQRREHECKDLFHSFFPPGGIRAVVPLCFCMLF